MRRRFLAFLSACLFASAHTAFAENWPEFRGPSGQGHYTGKKLPIVWSTTENVVWKTKIPGAGWSSPIIWKGRVYLTSAIPIKDSKDLSLSALCLDAGDGKILWQTEAIRQDAAKPARVHPKNSHASPTPITDGQRLYVHFGHQGTACLDLAGKVLWRTTEHRYAPVHGAGGTPILVDDRLIFSADGGDTQHVIALNTATGKTIWKTKRNSEAFKKFSFSTPLLITVNNQKQIVSPGSDAVVAYDLDGKELWRAKYDGYSVIPRPVFGHGMVFFSTGYDSPSVMAVRVNGKGDVTENHVAWTLAKGAPHAPSPLLVGDELYIVSDSGIASCLDARTGAVHWQERVTGNFSASPTHADGKLYLQSEDGVTTVLKAGKTFERLAENELKERTFASHAVADGAIYLRTETQLYRIQAK
ncbi:MAG: PQQ-binding-like beta-propeller repeat protein [Gemmataceae bacterium]|nr:PQQ-binding-like beta-propeller repeat protein [Gemmataceae bacterium]